MNDFSRLLKEAAGQPPRPLDMAAVRLRAARLRAVRRGGLWLLGILAVLGIGVPTGVSLAPSGSRPAEVRTIDVDHETPDPVAASQERKPEHVPSGGPAHDVDRSPAVVRPTPTTLAGSVTSTTNPSTGCSHVGPVAADCGERDATTCWAARVSCPTTTTTRRSG